MSDDQTKSIVDAIEYLGQSDFVSKQRMASAIKAMREENKALTAQVERLRAAIKEHKNSFDPDDATHEDEQLWAAIAETASDGEGVN